MDEPVFGRLSLRQNIILLSGFGLGWVTHMYTDSPLFLMAPAVAIGLALRYPAKPFKVDPDSLSKLRAELGETKFKTKLERKRAEFQSQIHMRRKQGLVEDPKLNAALHVIEENLSRLI